MPYKMEVGALIADWWGFVVFLVGVGVAYITGKERQHYKVEQLQKDLLSLKKDMADGREALKKDIASVPKELSDMHAQDGSEAVAAAKAITELATDVKYLRKGMDDLHAELRRKVDK